MITKIKTDSPDLRKEFLYILSERYDNPDVPSRTGQLLVSVGPQTEVNGDYLFEVEYE